ncbi:MAG: methyltransferase domain-containing protein [Phycisphaerae bacterium]
MDRAGTIPLRRLLDPRLAHAAARQPLDDAVNIPFDELPSRTHELPPASQPIRVAAVDESAEFAQRWLTDHGRHAEICPAFKFTGAPQQPGRLWSPCAFLESALPEIQGRAALDLACGVGRDAVYIAACGWDVVAIDWLPDALERGRSLAARYPQLLGNIEWRRVDLEAEDTQPPDGRRFDLITCFRFLHRPLLARLHEWLAPRGVLLVETFTTLHRARHGKPARDAHVLSPGELRDLLRDLDLLQFDEGWHGGTHSARVLARRRQLGL